MLRSFIVCLVVAQSAPASAEPTEVAKPAVAAETNLLWPFFPGGLSDFRVVVPLSASAMRGEITAGIYSDFAWRFVRDDGTYGRVAAMGTKFGYRQFFASGLHLEPVLQLNWRHERDRPEHPEPLNGFQGRAWLFAGYQRDVSKRIYLNARGGIGLHLFRTDELGDEEKVWVPAADLNIGIRL